MNTTANDFFAEIATMASGHSRPGLVVPEPQRCDPTPLPLETAPGEAALPRATGLIRTADQLATALADLRQRMAAYTVDLAPALPVARPAITLDRFAWRIETPEDRQDFARVQQGAGSWTPVTIPHYGEPLGKASTVYRAEFDLPPGLAASDRQVLCFGGVDYRCQVYVNGLMIGTHEGFFDAFDCDATGAVRPHGNVLVVRVENDHSMLGHAMHDGEVAGDKIYAATGLGYDEPQHGWHHCPAGMGIWNTVRLEGRPAIHLGDLWVRPLPAEEAVEVRFEVHNHSGDPNAEVDFLVSIYGQNFPLTVVEKCAEKPSALRIRGFGDLDHGYAPEPLVMGPGVNHLTIRLALANPRLWDLETPWLYQAQVHLVGADGRISDALQQQFGVRTFIQDETSEPKGRFVLNGREIRLRGANTMGHLERCVMTGNLDQLRDDILLAKLTHMNFLRLTQRPVMKEVYAWCDRLGLMLQTDMPLFATVRRNQMLEVVRQAAVMERHVRPYACNIICSFINEPVPAAKGRPHRFLLRDELERMFVMGREAILQENPDRVIKNVDGDYDPPTRVGMQDNHVYCGWYLGHGIDIGALHQGTWLPTKPGWYYGCGEFGSEGIDSYGVMQRHYPAAWKPASPEAPWSPIVLAESQSWKFHFVWYDTPRNATEWIRASQEHQAWVTQLQTEAYRRMARMNTFAIHLFIDAWPCGWMKTIMDVDRVPKQGWFAYHRALAPVALSLRCDLLQAWAGQTVPVEVWIANDTATALTGHRVRYQVRVDGVATAAGEAPVVIPANAPQSQGIIDVAVPALERRGRITVEAVLLDAAGRAIHDADLALTIVPRLAPRPTAVWTDGPAGERVLADLGLPVHRGDPRSAAACLVTDPVAYQRGRQAIDGAVAAGATAVFLPLPPGTHDIGGHSVGIRTAGMGPRHFVSRDTGHPLVAGFGAEDFKRWHHDALGRSAPLQLTVIDAPDWTTIIRSGDGGWNRPWDYAPAVAERTSGQGRWRLCQIEAARCVQTTPTAAHFLRRLLLDA